MIKRTATVGDLIKALSSLPADAPVFAYSDTDECDVPIQIAELREPRKETYIGETYIYPAHGCQGDSYVEDYWREQGAPCSVVYLRPRMWGEETLFEKEGE